MTKSELIRISACKTASKFAKGAVLFDEGSHLNGIYCIQEGVCKVSKMSSNGREQIIQLLQRGDLLGERSLINDETTNLKATALINMKVCFIPKQEIIRDLKENQSFSMEMLQKMANALKSADNLLVDLAQKKVIQRMAEMLLILEDRFGSNQEGFLNLQLSREDMANMIGTATESAIRLLSSLKKDKIIGMHGKSIALLDIPRLKKIARGF